ncbi:hypothetical protein [Actinomyces israelii]|nr:hypothetical protein [Actinomyces israelii]
MAAAVVTTVVWEPLRPSPDPAMIAGLSASGPFDPEPCAIDASLNGK